MFGFFKKTKREEKLHRLERKLRRTREKIQGTKKENLRILENCRRLEERNRRIEEELRLRRGASTLYDQLKDQLDNLAGLYKEVATTSREAQRIMFPMLRSIGETLKETQTQLVAVADVVSEGRWDFLSPKVRAVLSGKEISIRKFREAVEDKSN